MLNIHGIIRYLSLLLIFAGFGIPAAAADADILWAPKTVKGGFTIKLPGIDNDALVDEIAALKTALMHDKKLLSREAEQKRFTSKDTMLAALLPGGLLYAVYKKNAHAQAVRVYAQVSDQLKEITADLKTFTTTDGPVMVAHAR